MLLKHKSGENEKSVLGGVKLSLKLMVLIVFDRECLLHRRW